jgi:hypothetical protein
MRRLAGCLVVSLLASAAAWSGCRDDLGDEALPLLVGGGTAALDAIVVLDDAVVLTDGSGSGEGGIPDAPGEIDAGSGEGGIPDAPGGIDAGSGEGGIPDAPSGIDAGTGGDAYGGGTIDGAVDGATDDSGDATDDGGGGRPDARRGPEIDPIDRTSFYACAGGPGSAGLEVGLPIGLALAIAVRRRRRWRQAGSPDRAP